jgi:glucose-1-phosphate thymidylyltransferase
MLPVHTQPGHSGTAAKVEPVISYLVDSLRQAGVTEVRVVLREGKQDIADYLDGAGWNDMNFNYTITAGTSGVPASVALGLRDATGSNVAFGFPDILFEPVIAFSHLIERLQKNSSDVVLGLFPTENSTKMDMVQTGTDGSVTAIKIKPASSELEFAWVLAVWRPTFTRYLLDLLDEAPERIAAKALTDTDKHLGHIFQLAMEDGLAIEAEIFTHGRSLDIGTPDDLKLADDWICHGNGY